MNNKGRIKRRLHKLKQIEREKSDDRIVEPKVKENTQEEPKVEENTQEEPKVKENTQEPKVEENTQEPKEKSEIIIKNVDQVIVNNEFNIQSLNNDDKQLINDNIVLP
jgi:hypothetical protein